MMIFPWLIICIVIYLIYSKDGFKSISSKVKQSPVDILKIRYVSGEIDEGTYIDMKETLNK